MLKVQLTDLLHKEQMPEWIQFLQSLDEKQKKELSPHIMALLKDTSEFVELTPGTWGSKGKATHGDMLQLAAFVCMNKTDYEKTPYYVSLLNEESIRPILQWYCPAWLSDVINKQADLRELPFYLHYNWLMELTQMGALTPAPALIAKSLYPLIYTMKDRTWHYHPERLLKHPVTLREHIWCLFRYECDIHIFERYILSKDGFGRDNSGWTEAFKRYTASGHIDRARLLGEALQASNNNFNKLASGWFAGLFMDLSPTQDEILNLQHRLFNVLHSPHSKPVNTALDCLKKIIDLEAFNIHGFLEQAPLLLSSDAKNLVGSVLQMLEKLATRHASLRPAIAALTVQVFIQPDEALQIKAARLIVKLQKAPDAVFSAALKPYINSMKLQASKVLEPLVVSITPVQNASPAVPAPVPSPPSALPVVNNTDDLIFLASQAFENNQSWHIDVLPAALLQYHAQLQGASANKLEPALQRALKIHSSNYVFNSRQGFLDDLLAAFFADICLHLVQSSPQQTGSLQALYKKYGIDPSLSSGKGYFLNRWQNGRHDGSAYQPHRDLLSLALQLFTSGSSLPLLSTPTHEPGWVDPLTLVQRLAAWQQAPHRPASVDLQVALSRCRLNNADEALAVAGQTLKGEYLNLVLFLLGAHIEPQGPFIDAAAWMAASLAKPEKKKYAALERLGYYTTAFDYYGGLYAWRFSEERTLTHFFDQQLQSFREGIAMQQTLVPQFPSSRKVEQDTLTDLLYEYIVPLRYPFWGMHTDTRRLILLVPNNPGPQLGRLLSANLTHSTFFEVSDRDSVNVAMQLVYDIWDTMDEPVHIFLATCMLSGDKTIKSLAGETWLKGVSQDRLNQEQTGRTLGLQLGVNYAPLKRLTDMVEQQLQGVSDLHNRQLQLLLENLLAGLPDEPVKHLKKLLELYTELLVINQSGLSNEAVQSKLLIWRDTTGLRKIIERCL